MAGKKKEIIAYIPARGGSKRVPGKNIRPLGGKPVLAHVIDALRSLPFLEAICVSSDDEQVRNIAEANGAVTLEPRSPELADDFTTFMTLLQKDVPRFIEHCGLDRKTANVLWVLPTAALVTPDIYRAAYDEFLATGAEILTATTVFDNSPFRALVPGEGGRWKPLFPDKLLTRSQDLPETRVDCGLFYFLRYGPMAAATGHWFNVGDGPAAFSVPASLAIDVDTPEDWHRLEQAFAAR